MGNFEKLSVLVIGVIIVMILVVAIHTWTTDPGTPDADGTATVATTNTLNQTPLTGTSIPEVSSGMLELTPDPWDFEEATATLDVEASESDVEETTEDTPAEPEEVAQTTEPAPAPGVQRTVTVKPGDTLGHISQRMYDTTRHWKKIQDANDGIRADRLRPGMVLVIPYIPDAQPGGGGETTPVSIRGERYTVRAGDTIQKIAQAAYGSIERWPELWTENLEVIRDPERLPVGTEIRLPR